MTTIQLPYKHSITVSAEEAEEYEKLDTANMNASKSVFASEKLVASGKIVPCYRFNGYPCSTKLAYIFLEKYDIADEEHRWQREFDGTNIIVKSPKYLCY